MTVRAEISDVRIRNILDHVEPAPNPDWVTASCLLSLDVLRPLLHPVLESEASYDAGKDGGQRRALGLWPPAVEEGPRRHC